MNRLLLTAAFAAVASFAQAEPFTFVALGDAPYGDPAEVYAPYKVLIETINALSPKLVLHIGDTKSGSTPCSNEIIDQQLVFMNSFTAPVLYTPGDNEWTDCHRKKAGEFDPLERLTYLRTTYFKDGSKSLGTPQMDLTSQAAAGYPENARTMVNDVMFMTAHVVGSNNNFEVRDIKAINEFMARDAADITWLQESFAAAKDAKALVLGIQADMFEFDWNAEGDYTWLRHSGFTNFGTELKTQAAAFGKPVLLVYGDSHTYRIGRPFPLDAANVMSLEVPGEEQMHAVEVTVDTATSGVFSTNIVMNPALTTQ